MSKKNKQEIPDFVLVGEFCEKIGPSAIVRHGLFCLNGKKAAAGQVAASSASSCNPWLLLVSCADNGAQQVEV